MPRPGEKNALLWPPPSESRLNHLMFDFPSCSFELCIIEIDIMYLFSVRGVICVLVVLIRVEEVLSHYNHGNINGK